MYGVLASHLRTYLAGDFPDIALAENICPDPFIVANSATSRRLLRVMDEGFLTSTNKYR